MIETSAEEIEYLKELNKNLTRIGKGILIIAEGYLEVSDAARNNVLFKQVIKDFKEALKLSERGYK